MSKTPAIDAIPSDLLLDQQLCFALYSSSLAMTKRYKTLLAPLGLTYPQYLVMLTLWEEDQVTVKQLGLRLHLDSGTLTPLLKRLEQSGLLHRIRSQADERQVLVSLTESGKALREQARSIPQQLACSLESSWTELGQLRSSLHRLRRSLEQP